MPVKSKFPQMPLYDQLWLAVLSSTSYLAIDPKTQVSKNVTLMAWDSIWYGRRSLLVFAERRMNAQDYIHNVLKPIVTPYLQKTEKRVSSEGNVLTQILFSIIINISLNLDHSFKYILLNEAVKFWSILLKNFFRGYL